MTKDILYIRISLTENTKHFGGGKMIKANIEAAIESKQKELSKNRDDILKLDKVLESIKLQQKKLLEKDTDLCYELEELKEQLNEL